MKFTDLFIKRPVLAIVVNLVILIAGLQSIRSLSVRQYPRSDIAVVNVSTVYVGANADLVRGFITTPLERVIASADGIDYMESSSTQGLSTITVHLKLNYDTNAALTQIQAKVAQVRNDLPPDSQAPVIDLETADNQFAAMYLGFSSSDLDQNQITDYLTRVVQPKLSAVSGVQRADILGDRTFAMRIWLKPDKMAALGISPSQVWDALGKNNYLSAIGSTKGSMVSVNLVANTNLTTPEEFRQLVVKNSNGTAWTYWNLTPSLFGRCTGPDFPDLSILRVFGEPAIPVLVQRQPIGGGDFGKSRVFAGFWIEQSHWTAGRPDSSLRVDPQSVFVAAGRDALFARHIGIRKFTDLLRLRVPASQLVGALLRQPDAAIRRGHCRMDCRRGVIRHAEFIDGAGFGIEPADPVRRAVIGDPVHAIFVFNGTPWHPVVFWNPVFDIDDLHRLVRKSAHQSFVAGHVLGRPRQDGMFAE